MKILFIGNCFLYYAGAYLPLILNKLNIKNVKITIIYISSGRAYTFNDYFNHTLSDKEIIHQPHVKYPQVIYRYTGKENDFIMDRLPDISIKDVIKSDTWDKIVICTHLGNFISWKYDELYKHFKSYVNKIRAISKADIYYKDMTLINKGIFMNEDDIKKYIGKKISGDKGKQRNFFNDIDSKLCKDLNLIRIPMCSYYERLKEHINNKYNLLVDYYHPDYGLGRYFQSCVLYHFLIEPMTGIKLPDKGINIDVSKKFYKSIDTLKETRDSCINVDNKTIKICNKIIYDEVHSISQLKKDIAEGRIVRLSTGRGFIWKKIK